MNARRPNKTVDGTRKNTALTPNRGALIVGDSKPPVEKAEKPKTRIPFGSYMDPELQRRFKSECALLGVEMQSALEEAVLDWLNKHPRAAG